MALDGVQDAKPGVQGARRPGGKRHGLHFGSLDPARAVHLCVDMQGLFTEETDWNTPWMRRVLPVIAGLVRASPGRTVFTRFIPPHRAADAPGTWRRYYERWGTMTAAALEPRLLDVLPELRRLAPDAPVFDKHTYSPWVEPELEGFLRDRGADTLVISGTETDVCVLAAVLGAVDRGFRVVVPTDAICSSADETHDALMALYHNRFGQQIETATAAEVLASWQ